MLLFFDYLSQMAVNSQLELFIETAVLHVKIITKKLQKNDKILNDEKRIQTQQISTKIMLKNEHQGIEKDKLITKKQPKSNLKEAIKEINDVAILKQNTIRNKFKLDLLMNKEVSTQKIFKNEQMNLISSLKTDFNEFLPLSTALVLETNKNSPLLFCLSPNTVSTEFKFSNNTEDNLMSDISWVHTEINKTKTYASSNSKNAIQSNQTIAESYLFHKTWKINPFIKQIENSIDFKAEALQLEKMESKRSKSSDQKNKKQTMEEEHSVFSDLNRRLFDNRSSSKIRLPIILSRINTQNTLNNSNDFILNHQNDSGFLSIKSRSRSRKNHVIFVKEVKKQSTIFEKNETQKIKAQEFWIKERVDFEVNEYKYVVNPISKLVDLSITFKYLSKEKLRENVIRVIFKGSQFLKQLEIPIDKKLKKNSMSATDSRK